MDDKPNSRKLRFPAPDGLDLEQKEPGDTIEFVAECEIEKSGKLCLKKLNGIELAGYDEPKPEPRNFEDAVTGETTENY